MNDTRSGEAMTVVREATPVDGDPVRMLPAEAYTSGEVLAWERRHLFAGGWTCLGRLDELLPAAGQEGSRILLCLSGKFYSARTIFLRRIG